MSAEHLDKLQSPRQAFTSAGFVSFIQLLGSSLDSRLPGTGVAAQETGALVFGSTHAPTGTQCRTWSSTSD
jgi:hypothetical protein